MKPVLLLTCLVVGIAASVVLAGCRPVTSPVSTPHITIANPNDIVTVTRSNGVTVITVVSPRGIGAAQVQFTPAQAADTIQLHFHLQGLEQATLDNGTVQLTVSRSSHPPYAVSQTLTHGGTTHAISEDDEHWMAVALTPDVAISPPTPRAPGTIAITLPPAFIDAQHSELRLRWIDFYR